MKKGFLIGVLIVASLTVITARQKGQSVDDIKTGRVLSQRTTVITNGVSSTPTSFQLALNNASVPGGIVLVPSCTDFQRYKLEPHGASLRDALDAIVAADPQYKWEANDQIINLLPRNSYPALLNTRIALFKIENAQNVNSVLDQLLATPEVRKAIVNLNLGSHLFRGGLGYFDPESVHKKEVSRKITISRNNATVRDILNDAARADGNAVWTYSEYKCGRNVFSLDFRVN